MKESLKNKAPAVNQATEQTSVKESISAVVSEPAKEISKNEITVLLQAYAELKKSEDKMVEYVLFNARTFQLTEKTITFEVENQVLQQQLENTKGELADYLRQKLGVSFQVNTLVTEREPEQKKLYTPVEKFNYLVSKYPVLEDLKKRLGLEINY